MPGSAVSPRTLIPPRWDRRAAFGAGLLVALLGAMVIAGWHAGSSRVVQLSAELVPMQYNTALGLIALGGALCFLVHRRRGPAMGLALIALAFGGWTLLEYTFDAPAALDTMFFDPPIVTLTSHRGRMSPLSAACFAITGITVFLMPVNGQERRRRVVVGSLGGLVLALSGTILLGYIAGLESTSAWGWMTQMAGHTALAFVVLSIALLWIDWASDDSDRGRFWFCVPVALCCAASSLFFWNAVRNQAALDAKKETGIRLSGVARRIEDEVASRTLSLLRMARRWQQSAAMGIRPEIAEPDAELYVQHLIGLFAVGRVAGNGMLVDWLAPRDHPDLRPANPADEGFWRAAIERARQLKRPCATRAYQTRGGHGGFALFVPFDSSRTDAPLLVALIDPALMVRAIVASEGPIWRSLSLEISGEPILGPGRGSPERAEERMIDVAGVTWTIHLGRSSVQPERLQSRLPAVALSVYLALSAVVVLASYLAESSRMRARELTRRQGELVEHAVELARSNAELDRFAYVAAHDLRSPLRAIDHLTQWLQEDLQPPLDEATAQRLSLIRQRVDRMNNLLGDLLTYARAGQGGADVERVDLSLLAARVFSMVGESSRFELVLDPALPVLDTARAPLEHVLLNLFANAIKHHDRERGRLELTVQDLGDRLEIVLADDGPGIPSRFHAKIFEIFQTLRPRDDLEASGMGLPISRKLVESVGGTLTLDIHEGRGATFRFTWPKVWDKQVSRAGTSRRELINEAGLRAQGWSA
jgi:signal transduction histidine kinase